MLEKFIRDKRKERDILLMTHIVIGYPSLESSFETVASMVEAGVDLMELQIPFSEPIADGPVILRANQKSLAGGTTVKDCLEFAAKAARTFDIPFLFMSYYNVLFKYGVRAFTQRMAVDQIRGAIVPDLPPEEAGDYLSAMHEHKLAPIFIFSPETPSARMNVISDAGKGFIYCVARKGVTGMETEFSKNLNDYLTRCREATELPLALGFGVKDKEDICYLTGKVDIAVIGSQTIRVLEESGVTAVGEFIRGLRSSN